MKVLDLQLFRIKREQQRLAQRVGTLALESHAGSVREMKTCFKTWLKSK